jgi:hypothetical protein
MEAIERKQHTCLLQRLVVFHHDGNGVRIGHVPGRACSYPFGIISIMNRILLSFTRKSNEPTPDRHG